MNGGEKESYTEKLTIAGSQVKFETISDQKYFPADKQIEMFLKKKKRQRIRSTLLFILGATLVLINLWLTLAIWPFAVGQYKKSRSNFSILLVRKFRSAQSKIIAKSLRHSLRILGNVITLADEKISKNIEASIIKRLMVVIIYIAPSIIIWNIRDYIAPIWKFIAIFCFAFGLGIYIYIVWVNAMLRVKNEKNIEKVVKKTSSRIKRKADGIFIGSLAAIYCNDRCWQLFFRELVGITKLCIIDISEITPNIEWELQAVTKTGSGDLKSPGLIFLANHQSLLNLEWIKCMNQYYDQISGIRNVRVFIYHSKWKKIFERNLSMASAELLCTMGEYKVKGKGAM